MLYNVFAIEAREDAINTKHPTTISPNIDITVTIIISLLYYTYLQRLLKPGQV
jgi:hypothetical protein